LTLDTGSIGYSYWAASLKRKENMATIADCIGKRKTREGTMMKSNREQRQAEDFIESSLRLLP